MIHDDSKNYVHLFDQVLRYLGCLSDICVQCERKMFWCLYYTATTVNVSQLRPLRHCVSAPGFFIG